MNADTLTQDRLKELLHYDPDTGVFTRLKRTSNRVMVGDIPGYINNQGYHCLSLLNKIRYAHRLAFLYMKGSFPAEQIDHINGMRHDNRWTNLRAATQFDNMKNQRLRITSKSGVTGVSWDSTYLKWRVVLTSEHRYIHIGYFDDKDAAISARKAANLKYDFHENHGSDNCLCQK